MQALLCEMNQKGEWNNLVSKEPYFALMQSWEWGDYKEKIGWKVFRIAVENNGSIIAGAQLLLKSIPLRLASIAYLPRGPFGNWVDDEIFKTLLSKFNEITQLNNTIFLKIEPPIQPCNTVEGLLSKYNFRKSTHNSQPLATIIMDISKDFESILQGMRKSTRRKIFNAERKGVRICPGVIENVDAFYKLMKITARRGGFIPKSYDYYLNEWEAFNRCNRAGFFLAYFEKKLIAAHIAYIFGQHAAFFHQVSSGEYSNLNSNCLLVWEEIKWAKSQNCFTYDLWGIPDDINETTSEDEESTDVERTDGLWGVYKFKRGFSKNIVSFIGSFDLVYKPLIYTTIMNNLINYQTIERGRVWFDRHL